MKKSPVVRLVQQIFMSVNLVDEFLRLLNVVELMELC